MIISDKMGNHLEIFERFEIEIGEIPLDPAEDDI